MANDAPILLTIALLWFATAVAPGPNFLVTTRTALRTDRATGLKTTLGIACGTAMWGLAGFFGVHALFTLAPWLYVGLKLGGSLWLMGIGVKYLLGSFRAEPVAVLPPRSSRSAVFLGFLTSIANPQSALSTTSLFAATMPPQPSIALGIGAVAVMTAVAIIWYGFVALALTTRPAAAAFLRLRRWIDRVAGLAFLAFGTKLAFER